MGSPGDGWRNTLRDAVVTIDQSDRAFSSVSDLVISLIGWQPLRSDHESFEMLGSASVPAALLAFRIVADRVAVFKRVRARAASPSISVLKLVVLMRWRTWWRSSASAKPASRSCS